MLVHEGPLGNTLCTKASPAIINYRDTVRLANVGGDSCKAAREIFLRNATRKSIERHYDIMYINPFSSGSTIHDAIYINIRSITLSLIYDSNFLILKFKLRVRKSYILIQLSMKEATLSKSCNIIYQHFII